MLINHYSGRTAPLTSKRCILHIYSTNIGTEYFKRGMYSPFFSLLQNAICFIILTYLVPVLFTFYIQGVLKLKKNNSGAKSLINLVGLIVFFETWEFHSVVHFFWDGRLLRLDNSYGHLERSSVTNTSNPWILSLSSCLEIESGQQLRRFESSS
jgi:hypothetical protein